MNGKAAFSSEAVHSFVDELFGEGLHAKRVRSLANATVGALRASSLAVSAIGHGLALAQEGRLSRHAIKQVDRLLSNDGIDVDALMADWAGYCLGSRTEIVVAMDWTDFDADGHSTLMLSLLTEHGRATPLLWLTVRKTELKERRNHYEYWIITRLAELLPTEVKVLLVADRGFGDTKLYGVLKDELHFDYVIRFRGNIKVTAAGESRPAKEWIGPSGRARLLREATVTAQGCPVGAVMCVHARDMKEPWCLATSLTTVTAKTLIDLYSRRWGIECSFRDAKDWRFGMGMSATRVSTPARRDRLWLIAALAIVLLTVLGAAGEAIGYDRHLRTSTTKRRVHSLFRQGVMYYQLIPNMTEDRLRPLILQFEKLIREHQLLKRTFGII
ncbi:IS4 family transposase [Sphingobium sp. CFD-2]|jgi:hypothetical protein|uniref:IS4 family transposase n=1 Tax=Sphingobium sp. CFD-2 TaxID=2878542 RepID=UPI000B3D4594|nr:MULTISPECIES: IS4 family transposase [Sphingomonadaceae]